MISGSSGRINVLVIGGGYFGQKRLAALFDLPSLYKVVGIIDSEPSRAAALKKKFNIPVFSALEAIPTKTADCAVIATPNNTHADLTVQALKKGWHVLCEKPLTPTPAEALRIMKASEKYGRFVKTGSNHRFFPEVEKAYEIAKSGRIGKPYRFEGSIGNDGSHARDSWFWDKRTSGGGTFIDNGCHLLDIARMFLGDFRYAYGHTATRFWKKASVEDSGIGIFLTGDKREAIVTSSWLKLTGYFAFAVHGELGQISADSNSASVTVVTRKNRLGKTYDFSAYPKESYQRELSYFASCIRRGRKPIPSARDGYEVIRMIDAIYRSDRTNKQITL